MAEAILYMLYSAIFFYFMSKVYIKTVGEVLNHSWVTAGLMLVINQKLGTSGVRLNIMHHIACFLKKFTLILIYPYWSKLTTIDQNKPGKYCTLIDL